MCIRDRNQVVAGTDRATQVLEQLLRLARLDPLTGLIAPDNIDLAELARQVFAGLRPPTATQAIRLAGSDAPLLVRGDAELLAIALRNLLDNAMRYTPGSSTITCLLYTSRCV